MTYLQFETYFKHKPPYLVGILNLTPDSFSDGGMYNSTQKALKRITELFEEGADLVELGGESTRPGSHPLTPEEEISRIEKVITFFSEPGRLALDTYHAKTAEFALTRGVRFINDVSALRGDAEMAFVVAHYNAFITMMYNKDSPLPHATDRKKDYGDVIRELVSFFEERASFAKSKGIKKEQIILDSGMGKFVSHDPKYSWEILARYHELTTLDFPFMIGTSRKGFLGVALQEREISSQRTALGAVEKGAVFVRTHSPKQCR